MVNASMGQREQAPVVLTNERVLEQVSGGDGAAETPTASGPIRDDAYRGPPSDIFAGVSEEQRKAVAELLRKTFEEIDKATPAPKFITKPVE